MSLSDCGSCWSTPCECGEGYKDWTTERIKEHIDMLLRVYRVRTVTEKIAETPSAIDGPIIPRKIYRQGITAASVLCDKHATSATVNAGGLEVPDAYLIKDRPNHPLDELLVDGGAQPPVDQKE